MLERNLTQLIRVTLHDNDISETVLRAIEAIWRDIPTSRILKWKGTKLPEESIAMSFAALVKRQVELVGEDHVAAVAEKLEPLIEFIKRVVWNLVTREDMVGGNLVLKVFATPDKLTADTT